MNVGIATQLRSRPFSRKGYHFTPVPESVGPVLDGNAAVVLFNSTGKFVRKGHTRWTVSKHTVTFGSVYLLNFKTGRRLAYYIVVEESLGPTVAPHGLVLPTVQPPIWSIGYDSMVAAARALETYQLTGVFAPLQRNDPYFDPPNFMSIGRNRFKRSLST